MKAKIKFFKQFLKDPQSIGAVFPSSRYLTKAILSGIDFSKDNIIIEYGPGDGAFTRKINENMTKGSILIVIELNVDFYNILKCRYKYYKNVIILNDSVDNIYDILKEYNINNVDYIVSGIPFSSLPKSLTRDILRKTYNIMNKDTVFFTFQYSKLKVNLFLSYFDKLTIRREWKNFPPAYILELRRL